MGYGRNPLVFKHDLPSTSMVYPPARQSKMNSGECTVPRAPTRTAVADRPLTDLTGCVQYSLGNALQTRPPCANLSSGIEFTLWRPSHRSFQTSQIGNVSAIVLA